MKRMMILLTAGLLITMSCCTGTQKPPESSVPVSQTETSVSASSASSPISESTQSAEQNSRSESVLKENGKAEQSVQTESSEKDEREEETMALQMTIGDTQVSVLWEENAAVRALEELCRTQPKSIRMSMYGGFEQVGSIGASLPTDNEHITTAAGDIVLYSGDQMVVFYGSNTWSYTRLGHITDQSEEALRELLSNGDTTITLSRK